MEAPRPAGLSAHVRTGGMDAAAHGHDKIMPLHHPPHGDRPGVGGPRSPQASRLAFHIAHARPDGVIVRYGRQSAAGFQIPVQDDLGTRGNHCQLVGSTPHRQGNTHCNRQQRQRPPPPGTGPALRTFNPGSIACGVHVSRIPRAPAPARVKDSSQRSLSSLCAVPKESSISLFTNSCHAASGSTLSETPIPGSPSHWPST